MNSLSQETVTENENNLEESYQTKNTFHDYYYLRHLSDDAAPVIFAKAKELGYEKNDWFLNYAASIVTKNTDWNHSDKIEGYLPQKPSIRKWNMSRWKAIYTYTEYYNSNKEFAHKVINYI